MSATGLPVSVLIADDSSVVRERLAVMLREVPEVCVVGETLNVSGTIEAVRRLRPAVLVLDLSMPGGSGLDVLRQMAGEQLKAMVLVLTNYSFPEYEKEACRFGASAFLNKSTQFMKVTGLVRDLVDQARAQATSGEPAVPSNPPAIFAAGGDLLPHSRSQLPSERAIPTAANPSLPAETEPGNRPSTTGSTVCARVETKRGQLFTIVKDNHEPLPHRPADRDA
jgi:DNA-binding NarL/FixJ family response regulator